MTMPPRPRPPGLQAERTQLSWERTAIGFLAIGAIVLFRHDGPLAAGRTIVAVATLLIALTVFGIARTRTRRARDCARTEVLLVGLSTVALAIVVVAMVLWFG
jgi:putative membrane protein